MQKLIIPAFALSLYATSVFGGETCGPGIYQRGVASQYSDTLHGGRTADGGRYNKGALTAAHRKLGFGTKVEVEDLKTKQKVVVTITDRGPFRKGRVIDLSKAARLKLGHHGKAGVYRVVLRVCKPDDA